MGRKAFDEKLAVIEAARTLEDPGQASMSLAKALTDRNNYAVSKAAAAVAVRGFVDLVPALLIAFERFLRNPAKTDPQCWAKIAIARALRDLGHRDPDVYLRGTRHFQPEPVWGGQQDTAAPLRSVCALALVETPAGDLDILTRLAEMLVDPEVPVRIDAARAIAQMNRPEGSLALRVKALSGDTEPEVTGQCLAALLALPVPGAVPFAAAFLDGSDAGVRLEAAGALLDAHRPDAFEVFRKHWGTERDPETRRAMLALAGASPLEQAGEFLLDAVARAPVDEAAAALRALASGRFRQLLRDRAAAAVRARAEERLGAEFARGFEAD